MREAEEAIRSEAAALLQQRAAKEIKRINPVQLVDPHTQIEEMRTQMRAAAAAEDYMKAAELKQRISATLEEHLESLRAQMKAAAISEDYLTAARIKSEISA